MDLKFSLAHKRKKDGWRRKRKTMKERKRLQDAKIAENIRNHHLRVIRPEPETVNVSEDRITLLYIP